MTRHGLNAAEAVVWINEETHEVRVRRHPLRMVDDLDHSWCDPIGAAYAEWQEASDEERVRLMLETAIDLAMQGFDLGEVLRAFADVEQFKALGSRSYPMCRALTKALTGKCLEPVTMTFCELLEAYG